MEEFSKTELEQERWKDIDGYDGAYQVSDLGRVRSRKSGEWRVMRLSKSINGYAQVGLNKNRKQKRFYVHRLVAQAFIPNCDESKIIINHIDECKQNNRFDNLEWCDYPYNLKYNDIHHRRINSKFNQLKNLYNPELSINDNIKLFSANGIECCSDTIWRVRKDLGLIDHKTKLDKIRPLYNPDLTYAENINIFKANGIECGVKTLWKLRKDLKLKRVRHNYKRNEIKPLYNPDLTIRENLELFKSNGIECSESTVWKLRQDLGLTKNNSNQ